jgi:hypothetical protein
LEEDDRNRQNRPGGYRFQRGMRQRAGCDSQFRTSKQINLAFTGGRDLAKLSPTNIPVDSIRRICSHQGVFIEAVRSQL